MVFKIKWIILVLLIQFSEVSFLYLVITKSFSHIKFRGLLELLDAMGAQPPALGDF